MAVEVSGENFQKYLVKTNEIRQLLVQIEEETGGMSTHVHKLRHPDFKKLVDMGEVIIPYIFHLITHEGAGWVYFLLLQQITGENPVKTEHLGRFVHHIIAWLSWYVESKYYPSDIYHGLV